MWSKLVACVAVRGNPSRINDDVSEEGVDFVGEEEEGEEEEEEDDTTVG
jgi:hypothetical protein